MSEFDKIVAIPDCHFPWANLDHINRIMDYIDWFQPDHVVQLGDIYDFYSFSRYPKDVSFITPKEELARAITDATSLWNTVKLAAPNAKRYQLRGNHSDRIKKMVQSKAPELEAVLDFLDVEQLWRFDGVITQANRRLPIEICEGVYAHHGDWLKTSKPGARVKDLLENIIFGHTHTGHVHYLPRFDRTLWELGCGHISFSDALPLAYAPIRKPTTNAGFGVVDKYGPRFISLE